MPTLKINSHFTPAQQRSIRLALEQLAISDKAQAIIEGLSPRSIRERWSGIAHRLHLRYGHTDRATVIVELVRNRHVEFLMLALCIWLGGLPNGTDMIRAPRTLRGPRTVRHQRYERTAANDPGIDIDFETGELIFWRAAA